MRARVVVIRNLLLCKLIKLNQLYLRKYKANTNTHTIPKKNKYLFKNRSNQAENRQKQTTHTNTIENKKKVVVLSAKRVP